MFTALLIFQVLLGVAIIGLVLLQQGKGADMGAAFGAGASGTVFGSRGGGSFFTRATAVLAALFFANSIILSSPLVRNVEDVSSSVTSRAVVDEETLITEEIPVVEEAVEEDMPAAPVDESAEEPVSDLPPAEEPAAASDSEADVVAVEPGNQDAPGDPADEAPE